MSLMKLPDGLEQEFPLEIQMVRKFYFSLSEKEQKDLEKKKRTKIKEDIRTGKTTKYCFECAKKINRTANFCEHCGIKQPELE